MPSHISMCQSGGISSGEHWSVTATNLDSENEEALPHPARYPSRSDKTPITLKNQFQRFSPARHRGENIRQVEGERKKKHIFNLTTCGDILLPGPWNQDSCCERARGPSVLSLHPEHPLAVRVWLLFALWQGGSFLTYLQQPTTVSRARCCDISRA